MRLQQINRKWKVLGVWVGERKEGVTGEQQRHTQKNGENYMEINYQQNDTQLTKGQECETEGGAEWKRLVGNTLREIQRVTKLLVYD